MTKPIRIVIADDHPLYREGVARTLSDDSALEVVAQADDAQAAVQLAAQHRPDVLLLDLSMPNGGGIAALKQVIASDHHPKIAMLTVSEDDDDVLQALKAGALGYILKGVGARDLVAIVKGLADGQSYVSPSLAAKILNAMRAGEAKRSQNPMDELSKREEDILRLVAEGKSNKEVGRDLDLQEKTVKHYMTSILQKLHVRNRVEAVVLARDLWKK